MAKILVPIKRVPDYNIRLKVSSDNKSVVTEGVSWIINPFDEIAVEEALRIKEARSDVEEIVVCSIGPAVTTEQVRSALAMGADRGILVTTDVAVDSDLAARIIAEIYKRDSYQLVIMGKQAIDSDANQTGQLLAAGLNLVQATFASKVEIDEKFEKALVTREVDGGLESIRVELPAVVTTDLRLNEPRLRSLPNIVKAKKKPLEEIALESLSLDISPKVRVVKMSLPSTRKGGLKVQTVEELVEKLKSEAKVI